MRRMYVLAVAGAFSVWGVNSVASTESGGGGPTTVDDAGEDVLLGALDAELVRTMRAPSGQAQAPYYLSSHLQLQSPPLHRRSQPSRPLPLLYLKLRRPNHHCFCSPPLRPSSPALIIPQLVSFLNARSNENSHCKLFRLATFPVSQLQHQRPRQLND